MILDAIKGKGVGRGGPRIGKVSGQDGPRIGMYPPPFIGNWPSTTGRGKKKTTNFQENSTYE